MTGNPGVTAGICPNPQCRKKLYFPSHEASIECTGCGQRHTVSGLKNLGNAEWFGLGAIGRLLQMQRDHKTALTDPEKLKVNGLSNYLCTILSPLLTTYGMDRTTGKAKLLTEMGKSQTFDCGQLGDRAFLIEPQHMMIPGYGRDRSGSHIYLKDTLEQIKRDNDNEERLVPIHADGDGHCLVHAVSRALVGWELFWHPLRVNLQQHFIDNLSKYKMQFQDFIDDSEWNLIIQECDPEFVPNSAEPTGLRNIHIFGLANVLKRPIILLDSLEGIQSSGDYSAIFLPYFSPPSECMNKDGVLNKPLCIAWSSLGRNHFIPLVGVKGRKCPVLSRHMISRTWGVPDLEIDKYVTFDRQGTCQIGGEKVLQSGYFQRLVGAMSDIFLQQHGISPALITDVYQHIFKANGLMFGMNLYLLLEKTRSSIEEKQLFVCLSCWLLCLAETMRQDWLMSDVGGNQNNVVMNQPHQIRRTCDHCGNDRLRLVRPDYTIEYVNGDRTSTKSAVSATGYKYFWNGKEYDSVPKLIPVLMEWGGRRVETKIPWFQDEEDESLNSNVYNIAGGLVQENFPGEFGSERLVQKVVDQILRQTKKPETERQAAEALTRSLDYDDPGAWSPLRASKAILTGLQSVHKEELNKSAAERQLKQRIENNAPKQQRKLSDQLERKHSSQSPEPNTRKTPERRVTSPSSSTSRFPLLCTTTTMAPATAGSGETPDPPSTSKRIRLSTSDGKNITLDLHSECTYLELQSLICQATDVPPIQQRIRYGFPPKELKPPASPAEDYTVPIHPGDKITLDILAIQEGPVKTPDSKTGQSVDKSKIHRLPARKDEPYWNSLAEGNIDEASDRVLQGLMDPRWTSGGDNLDHSLSTLAITAALENKDMWTYVQLRPHLFSVNGLFYKQVERDVGLKHGKHCQLPFLPHKVFVYNQFDDRLELCLEPYGHFPIENNVERNAGSMLPSSKCSNKSTHQPFSGPGHSLKSNTSQEERMPTDVPMSPKRHEARRLNTMCDPAVHQESIEEEDEEAAAEEETQEGGQDKVSPYRLSPLELTRNPPQPRAVPGSLNLLLTPEARLVRKGPGYSELSPIPENTLNEKTEMLLQLINMAGQAFSESIGQESHVPGRGRELSPQAQTVTALITSGALSSTPSVFSSSSSSLTSKSQESINKVIKSDILSFIKPSPGEPLPNQITSACSTSSTVAAGDSFSQTPQSVCEESSGSIRESINHVAEDAMLASPSFDWRSHQRIGGTDSTDSKSLFSGPCISDIVTEPQLLIPSQHDRDMESISTESAREYHRVSVGHCDSQEKVEMERESHCQIASLVDTELEADDQMQVGDEDNGSEEEAKDLDDLIIEEPTDHYPETEEHADTPTSEKMDST